MNNSILSRETYLFNTPLEVGLRCLVILNELEGKAIDLQRIIYLDYLLVHYGDIDSNYESLHPATPYRSGEILIKRDLVNQGLLLMLRKKLVEVEYGHNGILYKTPPYCEVFLNHFESKYMSQLRAMSKVLLERFSSYSDEELKEFMMDHIDRWGGEFTRESLVRGDK